MLCAVNSVGDKIKMGFAVASRRISRLHHIRVQGEAANGDAGATASYPEGPAQTSSEGGCTEQQALRADETAFCWKRIPPKTSTAEQKPQPGSKAPRETLTPFRG